MAVIHHAKYRIHGFLEVVRVNFRENRFEALIIPGVTGATGRKQFRSERGPSSLFRGLAGTDRDLRDFHRRYYGENGAGCKPRLIRLPRKWCLGGVHPHPPPRGRAFWPPHLSDSGRTNRIKAQYLFLWAI